MTTSKKLVDFSDSDDFVIWQEAAVDVLKSETAADGEADRRIGGYCSTEHLDRQDEVVLQKGLDFSEFVKWGYFNDNHNQATSAVIGIPDSVEYHPGRGWYTTGHMLKGFPRADDIWDLAKSLSGTKRRLGFSIEGKVTQRQDNKIVKARIRNVAITNQPVNPNCTWDLLAKSLAAGYSSSSGGGVLVPQDLEHDEVKTLWTCDAKKCKKAFATPSGLDRHMQSAHGIKRSLEVTDKFQRSHGLLTEDAAMALLQRIRPQYPETLCRKLFGYASQKGK